MAELKKIGMLSDFEIGTIQALDVLDERVLVANVNGEIFAISDNCPHADLPMFEDGILLEGCEVECPWHGSRFNLEDGKCLQGPSTEDIDSYHVTLDGNDVYLHREEL